MELKPITVTELTRRIKRQLEVSFDQLLLQGEISNLAFPRSGHVYFNLKDDMSQIAGVMFRSTANKVKFNLENGLEVVLKGRITVYEPRGTYQLIVNAIEPLGSGALQLAFEQLKAKLEKEGLFDVDRKKNLPFIPRKIGVVTSPTGAAIQDILNILNRRFPDIPVLINPVLVQGEGAASQIAEAIHQFQQIEEVDLLIVGRGGGSVEDLWAFNEEDVARAISRSKIPVISAVGHETDFTIADFVADLRAPTPSAAAELAVPLKLELVGRINDVKRKLTRLLKQKISSSRERIQLTEKRLRSPEWVIQAKVQRLDELLLRLEKALQLKLVQKKSKLESLKQQLNYLGPEKRIEVVQMQLKEFQHRMETRIHFLLEKRKNQLAELSHVLDSVSPLSVLKRGYSAVTDEKKDLVNSVDKVKVGSKILVNVPDGVIHSHVEKIKKKNSNPQ